MSKNPRDKIISLPNPHLRQRSRRVGVITHDIEQIVHDMISATLDWEDNRKHEVGVALAAPQIDTLLRIVVIREDFEDKKNRNFTILINPEITKYEGEKVEDYEGCLSIKDIYGKVPRYSKVRVKALDIHGKEFRFTAEGFLARVVQHEIDHTNGTVFIDHIKDATDAFYKLDDEGQLEPLNYDADIAANRLLW
jgi:peptide deformylase